ncbi:MAG TPA: glycosyl hydrolase family 28 protein [Pseudonocardiaceae bacterium]|nr:glycosyl hydrolase family 28 protein [Pseudonocardiaceae bacterium]
MSNAVSRGTQSTGHAVFRGGWPVVLAVIGLLLCWPCGASASALAGHPATTPVFNVRTFGAKGDGSNNDAPAVNKAIAAANSAGGGIVEFPSGTYEAGGSIHMMSNVTIQLDSGSTLAGASSGYDAPESNPNDKFQDFGHSHFHDAMIWGDRLTNIGFTGSGTIDGEGHFVTGNPKSGQADKLISLTRCNGLILDGITLKRGGHFAILTNDCGNIMSDHLTISTASDRDGWNVINAQHVKITNIADSSNDDALVFKSDWALGQTLNSGDVTVTNAHLSAGCCNALMFGSETCGNFTNYTFTNITITHAGKSGLGMVSMDGANISNVTYDNVTMSGTASPIMEKIGSRLRCGGSPKVGSISDIHYNGVTGTNAGSFSPTLWGASGHDISDVTFDGVNLTLPGGHGTMSTGVPSDNGDYNPNSIGTRPAYGFYLHDVTGISFTNSSVKFGEDDGRPAFIVNSAGPVTFDHVTAQRGGKSPFDVGFQTVKGFCVTSSTNTTGGALRVNSAGSTRSCSG